MDIVEQEFTAISRLKAQDAVKLSLGTLEIYLFIVRVGMKEGYYRDIAVRYKLFEGQGVTRRRLAKAVAELTEAGMLSCVPGSGVNPTRYTLPRLVDWQPAAAVDERANASPAIGYVAPAAPMAQPMANESLPMAQVAAPQQELVTVEEAAETLASISRTMQNLTETQLTPSVRRAIVAKLPDMGSDRDAIRNMLGNIADAVEESDYLQERMTLRWLFEGENWEKVVSGQYKRTTSKAKEYEPKGYKYDPTHRGQRIVTIEGGYEPVFPVWLTKEEQREDDAGVMFHDCMDGSRRNKFGQTREEFEAVRDAKRREQNRAMIERMQKADAARRALEAKQALEAQRAYA